MDSLAQRRRRSRCEPLARARGLASQESGQALVEFGLVLVPILLILFGIIEFGVALNAQNDQTHVASLVARYATVNEDPSGSESLQEWGKKQAPQRAERAGKLCIRFPAGTSVGEPVEVEFTSSKSWIPLLKLAKTTIVGKAVMRLEAPPSSSITGKECA